MKLNQSFRLIVVFSLMALVMTGCRFTRGQGQAKPPSAETQPIVVEATSTSAVEALTFQTGRNDYVTRIDGDPREFILYVPARYDASQLTPLVFMFHGSNQSGNIMYENTRWKEKADDENILVVFPTAWKYPLIGEGGVHEKWNDVTLNMLVEPGTELKDDVNFVRVMLEQIKATFNVDEKRIFATGFSNGGSFVSTRLLFEMNDVFAAFAICGSGIKLGFDIEGVELPKGILKSLYTIIGNSDDKIGEGTGHAQPFPMKAEDIFNDELFGPMLVNTAGILSLDPTYDVQYHEPAYTIMTFNDSMADADNEYIFQMVNNMGHVYPSVDNNRHGLDAAPLFWDFFMRHPLK